MRTILPLLALLIGLCSAAAYAQDAGAPPPPPPTLDAELAAAQPPDQGIALSLDAGSVKLQNGPAPANGSSLVNIAQAYNRIVQRFGYVTAIAPARMNIIYTPPAEPNPFVGMPQGEVFKLLAASFTPQNWQQIFSDQGLGIDDLATDEQKDEFKAFFPNWQIGVINDSSDDYSHPKMVSVDTSQVRIRLSQLMAVALPVPGQPDSHIFSDTEDPGVANRYMATTGTTDDWGAIAIDGAVVQDNLPNTLKASQLSYNAPIFETSIPLAGLKTVGDLIARISTATHVEIYADRRYEGKKLTFLGSAATAPANDLLRALALCTTGTYRQVGPAFVLTDDLIGLGTRRQMWVDFDQEAESMRSQTMKKADDSIKASNHSMRDIPWYGDPMAFTPDQLKEMDDQHQKNNMMVPSGMLQMTLPFDQLTGEQQQSARLAQAYNSKHSISSSLDGTVMLQSQLEMEALLPTLDGPVLLMGVDLVNMFPQQMPNFAPPPPPPSSANGTPLAPPPPPNLKQVLMGVPRRAVLVDPKSPADVDSIVGSMKTLGLNELWVVVFSEGTAHYPTRYATTDAPLSGPDILTEAIKDTQGTGIKVYAALNLLQWGPSPPADAADLNILGENSRQTEANQIKQQNEGAQAAGVMPFRQSDDPETAVCPLAPEVVPALTGMIQELAAKPGVAGIVWRDIVTPGYMPPPQYFSPSDEHDLGYNQAARLAFLRKGHVDPVDLSENRYTAGRANTRLDGFDQFDLDRTLFDDWLKFRGEVDVDFLRSVAAPLNLDDGPKKHLSGKTPLLVQVRTTADRMGTPWYGSWENLQAPIPTMPEINGENYNDALKQARQASRISLYDDNLWDLPIEEKYTDHIAGQVARGIAYLLPDKTYAGIVLDFTPLYSPYQSLDFTPDANPLAPLAKDVSGSPPPTKNP
jgi:hypothetical protein